MVVLTLPNMKELGDVLGDAEFWQEQRDALRPTIEKLFRRLFIAGSELATELAPTRAAAKAEILPLDPDAIAAAMTETVSAYVDTWYLQFTLSTQNSIREAIADSVADGTGVEGVIKKIEPLFGKERALRIASTESTRLIGKGAQATYAASGIKEWEWQTVQDSRVCVICAGRLGERFPIEYPFDPAHVNCRCFPRPVVAPEL